MEHTDDESTVPSARTYVLVWFVLIVLATASLFVSNVIPGGSLAISIAIAAVKAALVAAFFMHLAHGRPVHRMAFVAALAFFLLLMLGVIADIGTRSFASAYVDDVGN
jgi:cytochrome c oxidase subunit 4